MAALVSLSSATERSRAASDLLALSSAGALTDAALHDLGSIVLGRDLDASTWPLCELGHVPVPLGLVPRALRSALASAFTPQRARVGEVWAKKNGKVDGSCMPAHFEPERFARWLRGKCFRYVREVLGRWASSEPQGPVLTPTVLIEETVENQAQVVTEGQYTRCAAEGAERAMIVAEQKLEVDEIVSGIASLVRENERPTIDLLMEGRKPGEIAKIRGCADRTIRRHRDSVRERARKGGLDAPEFTTGVAAWVTEGGGYAPVGDGLRALVRPMTADEAADLRAGYPASRYRRLARPTLAPDQRSVTLKLAA